MEDDDRARGKVEGAKETGQTGPGKETEDNLLSILSKKQKYYTLRLSSAHTNYMEIGELTILWLTTNTRAEQPALLRRGSREVLLLITWRRPA